MHFCLRATQLPTNILNKSNSNGSRGENACLIIIRERPLIENLQRRKKGILCLLAGGETSVMRKCVAMMYMDIMKG